MSSLMQRQEAVLITGAAKRIGRALARALAQAGYTIIIHCNQATADAEELVATLRKQGMDVYCLSADLTDTDACAALMKRVQMVTGNLRYLINNASIFENDTPNDVNIDLFNKHIAVNLRAPILLTSLFAQATVSTPGDKAVIHIIDQRVWRITPQFFSYGLSKSALWVATRSQAQALAKYGTRVNAIGPGPTLKNPRQSEKDWQAQNAAMPLGHGATPQQIADTVLFLLNQPSITGQMIAVDGGQHLAWETPDILIKE